MVRRKSEPTKKNQQQKKITNAEGEEGYYRLAPGVQALYEIRKYQKSTELLIGKLPFKRLCQGILNNIKEGYRINSEGYTAIQVGFFEVLG